MCARTFLISCNADITYFFLLCALLERSGWRSLPLVDLWRTLLYVYLYGILLWELLLNGMLCWVCKLWRTWRLPVAERFIDSVCLTYCNAYGLPNSF